MRIGGANPQLSQMTQMVEKSMGAAGGGQGSQAAQGAQGMQGESTGLDTTKALEGPSGFSSARRLMPGEDFGSMLKGALQEVNKVQQESRGMQNDLMQGKPVEFHELMITMEKASTAMTLTLQVRNKLLEAYQEISRTQI